jgi:branched-subunit amino acid transport protein
MIVRPEVLGLILACMAVTLLPRVLPMALINIAPLPRWFLAWLRHIPVAVIAALLFKEIATAGGELRHWQDPYLGGGVAALLVAFASRSIVISIVGGAAAFLLLRHFL